MSHSAAEFRDTMRAIGLNPPDTIVAGRFYRFPGVGKRHGNSAGWCRLFDDGSAGCYGDWSIGLSRTWHAHRSGPRSPEEQRAIRERAAAAKREAEAGRLAVQGDAAARAAAIWERAQPAPRTHPYLVLKGIGPYQARVYRGALTLPVMTFRDRLVSLQFIRADGQKHLLTGGRKRGCFIPVTHITSCPQSVVVCEGWATGCTLAKTERNALVLAAIDAGNLKSIAVSARDRWPQTELVIAADDDRLTPGNPGATKARSAASAADALLALPDWPADAPETLTDFNDLAQWLVRGTP